MVAVSRISSPTFTLAGLVLDVRLTLGWFFVTNVVSNLSLYALVNAPSRSQPL